jgi:hypothetical protein
MASRVEITPLAAQYPLLGRCELVVGEHAAAMHLFELLKLLGDGGLRRCRPWAGFRKIARKQL